MLYYNRFKHTFFLLISFFLPLSRIYCTYYQKLRFEKDKEFTILQFTDLHYGEDGWKDRNSKNLQDKLIGYTNPDLVVLTGDMVSGYGWNGVDNAFYLNCWKQWTQPMESRKIPYAYTLGNHDSEGDLNRKQVVDLDTTNNYSLIQYNSEVTGASNYFVPIYSSNKTQNTPVSLLWLFDTNSEVCQGMTDSWGCFEKDQISWYEEETERIKRHLGYVPQGLAFFHIPVPEYRDCYNWRKTYGKRNEVISCPKKNTELFKSMLVKGNINATFCGHDHDNDFGAFFFDIELVYGRKTGYGGYGPSWFSRGARVIKLKEKINENTGEITFDYRHYVIEESGNIVQNSEPLWRGGYDYVDRCER